MTDHNHQDPQETDIIVLLNYFKNGIKSIFHKIGLLFKGILSFFIGAALIIKKNLVLFIVTILVFGVLGYIQKNILSKKYAYEIVVAPQYNSQNALHSLVSSYINNVQQDSLENIVAVSISPVIDYKSKVNMYYNVVNNDFDIQSDYKKSKDLDTIFYRQVKLEDFESVLKDEDYPVQKIYIKSTKPIDKNKLISMFVQPIETNPYFIRMKASYLQRLDLQSTYYRNMIFALDTLMLSIGEKSSKEGDGINISYGGGTASKSTSIEDVLHRYKQFSDVVATNEVKKVKYQNIIEVLSVGTNVEVETLLPGKLYEWILWGIAFAFMIVLGLRLIRYLQKIEDKNSITN